MVSRVTPMSESDGDPSRRPSVDLLLHKLKNLKTLKGHPDAVLFIIRNLVHKFFIEEEKRPAHLWTLINYDMYAFQGLMGGGIVHRNDKAMNQFAGENGLALGNAIHNAIEGYLTVDGSLGEAPPGENQNRNSKSASLLVLEEVKQERGEASGDRTVILEDALADEVERIIFKHRQVLGKVGICGCGRNVKDDIGWAHHIRIRIWRYMQNEFKGDD